MAVLLGLLLAALLFPETLRAGTVMQQLHEFPGTAPGPWHPASRLAERPAGVFYGTTAKGGTNDRGAVFRYSRTNGIEVLHAFNGPDGSNPFGGLVFGVDATLYGTTTGGGGNGLGTVFKITTTGSFASLASFGGTNGSRPYGRLARGNDGHFYGVTTQGGEFDLGTVFRITTNGLLTRIFSFAGTNGCQPFGGLTESPSGDLYGTTRFGGLDFSGLSTGSGTVFKVNTNGVVNLLVPFNQTNGMFPFAGLTLGSDGHFHGTTESDNGGGGSGYGTVFSMSPAGELTTRAYFSGTNGASPLGGVAQGRDGSWYGTTSYALADSEPTNGTLFKLSTNNTLTTLAHLSETAGQHPFSSLMLASDGNIYGTMADSTLNNAFNGGVLFRLVEAPQVKASVPASGNVTLAWNSFTNAAYRVEFSPSLTGSVWTILASNVTAFSNSVSFSDLSATPRERYYRVILQP